MAKTSLTGLTPGDANPKKKANQKRTRLAKGNSTGDVSQVNLQFEQPKIQQFRWYGDTYSKPTEANLVPTLDLPSVQGYYDETRVAKQNEFSAFIDSMKTLKGEVGQLDDNYTKFRVEEQKYLTQQASQVLDTYTLGNDGTEVNPANKLNSIEKQLMKIIAKKDDKTGILNETDLEEVRFAEKTLKEIRKNKRLQNTILSQIEERKVYDNISTWNNKKNSLKVDYLDKEGNKVQLIENGEPQFEADGTTPIYEQVTVGELSPDDERYKDAYNKHIYGNAKLGVFEHNNTNGYVTQHRMNDRTSQDTTYQNILNKQESTEITGDIGTLRNSIKNDSTFTDAKLSESVGTIVERINKANHLPDDSKKQLVKDLIGAIAESKNLSGLDTFEFLKDLFYGDPDNDGVNGIGTGTSNSRYKEVDGGYVLNTFFIDSYGGERFLRDIVTNVVRERNDFETADKFLRDVQNQDNLMDGVDKIQIDDGSAKDILANYNANGTENEIKADTKVIQAKKAILAKIDENFEKAIDDLNRKKDQKTITTSEFNNRIEELQKSREDLLKNIVYDLTPTEFRSDVKLLKKDAQACLLAGENSNACVKYLSSYKSLTGIYGQEVVDLQTGIADTHKNILDMEGNIVAKAIETSLLNQEEEFKKTYRNSKPEAGDTEVNAAWDQIKDSVSKYLIDTYFEMTSDGKKVTGTQLNDRVRDDKENGVFAQFFDIEGVDPLVTGKKVTASWYGQTEPGTSFVGDSTGNYGNIINNRLSDVNFDANDLYRAGTDEYSFVLHIDSPNGVVFNPEAGTQFYLNILFSGREGKTLGGVFYSPHQIYSNQLNANQFTSKPDEVRHGKKMTMKSQAAYKNLENLFALLEATNKYGSGDGVDLGNFIIFETENSIKNLYPEAVTDGVIDYNHPSIPANLKDFSQHKEFLLKLNGIETFQDARGMILKYNQNLGL
tara:strand:+ start:1173 stop:4013 length:2841 start_codon:yes stop_codon:yes gene_type:complete